MPTRTRTSRKTKKTKTGKMRNVTLFAALSEKAIDRPLSRTLRDRAAALSFGDGKFAYAPEKPGEKPRFSSPAGAYFNVTHTGRLFLMALADTEVGIDAQTAPDKTRALAVARRFFAPEEAAELAALPEEERPLAFARLWTKKEAAAKYTGEGIFRAGALSAPAPKLVFTDLLPRLPEKYRASCAAAVLCTGQPVTLTVCLM